MKSLHLLIGALTLAAAVTFPAAQAPPGARIDCVAGCGTDPLSGPAERVQLAEPFAVTFDGFGNWYIAEYKGHRVTRVDPGGHASVIAGAPLEGMTFNQPHALAMTPDGQLYVADTMNHRLVKVELPGGRASVVAGTGERGFSGDEGPGTAATFNQLYDIAADGYLLYIADLQNRRVRLLDLNSNIITTVAGNGEAGVPADGARAVASPLVDPRAVAVDRQKRLYILERRGNAVRVVERNGTIRTLVKPDAGLNGPKHLAVDGRGRILIADTENHVIKLYAPTDGSLTVIAGSGTRGAALVRNDPLQTELNRPHGVYLHRSGAIYISDSENNRVLRLTGWDRPARSPATDLSGAIDLHAHADPDVSPRPVDILALAKAAQAAGMRGLLLKSHGTPTAAHAWFVRQAVPNLEIFGGLALNRAAGGLNAAAVEATASMKGGLGRVVWLPTFDAANHVKTFGEDRPAIPLIENGRIVEDARAVLKTIAARDLTLATGHSSAEETLLVLAEAKRLGVRRMLVTHAMMDPVRMTIPQQREAAALGAVIEHAYQNTIQGPDAAVAAMRKWRRVTAKEFADAIRAVGATHCVLSSDLGQVGNPPHLDGLRAFIAALRKEGISASDLALMTRTNPARVLGLSAPASSRTP